MSNNRTDRINGDGQVTGAKSKTETQPRFVKIDEVASRCALSKSAIYNKMKDGSFPKQFPISAKAVAWLESDIDAWMKSRCMRRKADEVGES